jgi:hypothetical protein
MNDPKLVDMLSTLIEIAASKYEANWTPSSGDEMIVPQIMVFVDNQYDTCLVPSSISTAIFANPASKAALAEETQRTIRQSNGKLLALLVVSETWHATQSSEESAARKARKEDVRSVPGAKTAFMGAIYTADDTQVYIQVMHEGKREGPVKHMGGEGTILTGVMVGKHDGESEA